MSLYAWIFIFILTPRRNLWSKMISNRFCNYESPNSPSYGTVCNFSIHLIYNTHIYINIYTQYAMFLRVFFTIFLQISTRKSLSILTWWRATDYVNFFRFTAILARKIFVMEKDFCMYFWDGFHSTFNNLSQKNWTKNNWKYRFYQNVLLKNVFLAPLKFSCGLLFFWRF